MARKARTLRSLVALDNRCNERFKEAEYLAKSIFNRKRGYVPLPFFVEHGKKHCEMVEKYLDEIIWRKREEPGEDDFIPSQEEAMYLLSAVWLHDIGMMYGIWDNEKPQKLRDHKLAVRLRNEHEFRTASYINQQWNDCDWVELEKHWLSNICVFHRRHHPISTFDPAKPRGEDGRYIRLAVLAALLRLADACHEDQSRAPEPVMGLYISLGMPQEAIKYWERAKLIQRINFDHKERKIILTGHYPPKHEFDLGEFDLQEVGEIICRDVQDELRSVRQILSHYPNTSFREVQHEAHYLEALSPQTKRQCLGLWPYLLSKPTSSTEATAALVQVLLFATEEAEKSQSLGEVWQDQLTNIMNETQKSRPVDFMVRNLCKEVEEILSSHTTEEKRAKVLTKYLERLMKRIKENRNRIAERALKTIKPRDVLVLYGYNTNIEKLLRDLDKQHSLYIVECYKPIGTPLRLNEDKRITSLAQELGFAEVRFLYLPFVAQSLQELQRNKKPCKLLLGTHGVLKSGDLLCKVGSYMLAGTAKQFGATVITFAEGMKVLKNAISDDEIAGPEKLFSSKECKRHPELEDTMCLEPKMDLVPRSLVDIVVTEKGVKRVRVPARTKGGAVKTVGGSGKKANSRA